MDYSILSKARIELMGLALIFVVIFHLSTEFTGTLDQIKNLGDFGVNIFFLVSGMSMYYSWVKNPNTYTFIKSRLLRIGVAFLPVVILWCVPQYLIGRISLLELCLKVCTLHFWLDGNLLYWYISGIVFLYLITPVWMSLFKRNHRICMITSISICLLLMLGVKKEPLSHLTIFIDRMPCYFMGLYLGYMSKEKRKITYVGIGINLLLFVGGVALVRINGFENMHIKYISYLLWTLPFVMGMAYLIAGKFNKYKYPILSLMGGITLEVYLLHERILFVTGVILQKLSINLDSYQIVLNIIALSATIIISYIYHKVTQDAYKQLRDREQVPMSEGV